MRAKGDGSIAQRKDGRWQASIIVEQDGAKKRRYFYGKTKTEVAAKLKKAQAEQARGELVAKTMTLGKWLDQWLELKRQPPRALKPNTWNGYESKLRLYVPKTLRLKRLTDIRPAQIDAIYADMRQRGLAEATVRQLHMILQKAFADAVRKQHLGKSPMERVDPPGTETNERDQWTMLQAAHALRCAGDSARWWLALFYGMRQGEVLGLDWRHVDWEHHEFSVEQTRQNDYGYTGAILGTPKADASMRTLPMLPEIEVRLRILWLDAGKPAAGLVFPNKVGRLKDPKRDWSDWREFIDSCTVIPYKPLPYIALHAARNTAASLMEAAGIPDRVVAQILGQSQVRTTHRYQRAEIERVRAYLTGVGDLLALDAGGDVIEGEIVESGSVELDGPAA